MKRISRRDLLAKTGLGVMALPLFGVWPHPARAAETLTGVTYLTPAYKALMWGMQGLVDRLQESAGEAATIDFYDSGTLVNADEQTTALRQGTIDFMFHTTSYITRSFEILGITGLPGVVEELYEHGDRLAMDSPLWQLINDELAKENLYMVTAGGGIVEPEYVWGAGDKIASLDDLKGKRVRVVSYEASTALEAFGVAPVRIPSAETYLALQRGTVDALVANISTIVGRSLHEQLDYAYKLPVTGFSIALFLLKDRWDQLDDATRSAFQDAAKWFDQNFATTVNNKFYKEEYWPMLREAGIEEIEPAQQEAERFDQHARTIWDWWKQQVGEETGQRAIDLALGQAA